MTGRLIRYVLASYPPVLSTVFAVAWAYGVTGLFAIVDPEPIRWRPGLGTFLAALTLVLNLLLMRVIDDIRDLDYDRAHSPKRPLPRGVVRISDLLTLYAVGAAVILVLNAGRGAALLIIAGQLSYALVVLAVHSRWHWPNGGNLPLTLLISCPAQILLHLYLYAGYPGHSNLWAALAVLVLASIHLELAKKIVRIPEPGERTYVLFFGLRPTVIVAVITPVAAIAVLFAAARSWSPWLLLAALPLALPAAAAWKFRPASSNRWNARYSAFYLLLTFVSFIPIGLLS